MATLINDDIPESWQANQIISPNGEPFGDEKRGWNFLMRKINTMIRQINSNSQDVEDKIQFELVTVLPDPEDANEQTFYQIEVEEDKYKLYYFLDGAFRPITPSWGDIDGTLANQTDLQNVLNSLVPNTRKINNKALSSDITLDAEDVGAAPTSHTHSYLPYGITSDLSYKTGFFSNTSGSSSLPLQCHGTLIEDSNVGTPYQLFIADYVPRIFKRTADRDWEELRTVVSTYQSGTSWYRKWSDGWIEQGGYIDRENDHSQTPVSFHTAFSNVGTVTVNVGQYTSGDGSLGVLVNTVTTTGFTPTIDGDVYARFCWYAYGY